MFLWMNVCLFKNVKVPKTDEIGASAKKVFNQIKKCWEKTCYSPILVVGPRPDWCSEYLPSYYLLGLI